MQTNSKFTQILLATIAVALIAITIVLIRNNSPRTTMIASRLDESLYPNAKEGNVAVAPVIAKNTTPSMQKKYESSYGTFSYKSTASIIPNGSLGVINIGTNANDPFIESVVFISDADEITPFYDNANYQKEIIGKNNFESFENIEEGYKHYVLVDGKKAISVTVKASGPRYVDLSSVSF